MGLFLLFPMNGRRVSEVTASFARSSTSECLVRFGFVPSSTSSVGVIFWKARERGYLKNHISFDSHLHGEVYWDLALAEDDDG